MIKSLYRVSATHESVKKQITIHKLTPYCAEIKTYIGGVQLDFIIQHYIPQKLVAAYRLDRIHRKRSVASRLRLFEVRTKNIKQSPNIKIHGTKIKLPITKSSTRSYRNKFELDLRLFRRSRQQWLRRIRSDGERPGWFPIREISDEASTIYIVGEKFRLPE